MNKTFLPDYLSIRDGILHYQGINLMNLLEKYGTPLEVSYTDLINERVKDLKNLFEESIKRNKYLGTYSYAYATKVNYSSEAVVTALNNIDLIETSSNNDLGILEELHNKGILPTGYTIICNGFKDKNYFDRIVRLVKKGLRVIPVIENLDEIEYILRLDTHIDIGIRINIDDAIRNLKIKPHGDQNTRFGIYFDDIPGIVQKIKNSPNLKLKLFHFHLGGTIQNINEWIRIIGYIYEHYYCEIKKLDTNLEYFDFGGGFPVQYSLGKKFNYKQLVDKTVKKIKAISDKHHLEHPQLIGEHGRYTVADHGFLLLKVNVVKQIEKNHYWYLVDSSFMGFLPDSWAIKQNFIIHPINLIKNKKTNVKLGGITCDPDDIYYDQEKRKYLKFPQIKTDEVLYLGVFGTGAYQKIISGVDSPHHCLIPEGVELVINKRNTKDHEYIVVDKKQTDKEILKILSYDKKTTLKNYTSNDK